MDEIKNSKDFFEKALPERFKPEKAQGIDAIAQVNITGIEEGNWTITIKNQKVNVTKGNNPSPTLTIKASEKDFMDVVNGKLSAEKAFFSSKVQFKGNIGVALKLKDAGFF